jgi:hypothetical protein
MLWAIIERTSDDELSRTWETLKGLYSSPDAARKIISEYKKEDPEARYVLRHLDSDIVSFSYSEDVETVAA